MCGLYPQASGFLCAEATSRHATTSMLHNCPGCECRLCEHRSNAGCVVQYMVVYQCIVAQASMTAFFVDGSSLDNLQVLHLLPCSWCVVFNCIVVFTLS